MKKVKTNFGKKFLAFILACTMCIPSVGVYADGGVDTYGNVSPSVPYKPDSSVQQYVISTDVPDKNSPIGQGYVLVQVAGTNTIYDHESNKLNISTVDNINKYLTDKNSVKKVVAYYTRDYNDANKKKNNYNAFKSNIDKIATAYNKDKGLSYRSVNIPCYTIEDEASLANVYNQLYAEEITKEKAYDLLKINTTYRQNKNAVISPEDLGAEDSLVIIPIYFCEYQPIDYLGTYITSEFWKPFYKSNTFSSGSILKDGDSSGNPTSADALKYAGSDISYYQCNNDIPGYQYALSAKLRWISSVTDKFQPKEYSSSYWYAVEDNPKFEGLIFDPDTKLGEQEIEAYGSIQKSRYIYTQDKNGDYYKSNGSYIKIPSGASIPENNRYTRTVEYYYEWDTSSTKKVKLTEVDGANFAYTSYAYLKLMTQVTTPNVSGHVQLGDANIRSVYDYSNAVYYVTSVYNYSKSNDKVTCSSGMFNCNTSDGKPRIGVTNKLRPDNNYIAYKGSIHKDYLIENGVGVFCLGMYGSNVSYDALVVQNSGSDDNTIKSSLNSLASWTTDNRLNTVGTGAYVKDSAYTPDDYKKANHKGYVSFKPSYDSAGNYAQTLNEIYASLSSNLGTVGYVAGYKNGGMSDDYPVYVPSWASDTLADGEVHSGSVYSYSFNGNKYKTVNGLLKAVANSSVNNDSATAGSKITTTITRDALADLSITLLDNQISTSDLDDYTKQNMIKYGKDVAETNTTKSPAETGFSATIQDPTFKVNSYVVPVIVDVNGDTGYVNSVTIDTDNVTTITLRNKKFESTGEYYNKWYTTKSNDSFYALVKGNTVNNSDVNTALINAISKSTISEDNGVGHITDCYNSVSGWATDIKERMSYIKTKDQQLVFGVQQSNPTKGYTAYIFRITKDGTPVDNPPDPDSENLIKTDEIVLEDYSLNVVYPNLIGSTADYSWALATNNQSKYGAFKIANTITLGDARNKLFSVSGDACADIYGKKNEVVSPMGDTKATVNTNAQKYINYAHEISRQTFNDKRVISGITYSNGSASNSFKFAKDYLGLTSGVVPDNNTVKLTGDSNIRNSAALFSRLSNTMQLTSGSEKATHPFMYAYRIADASGKVTAYNVGNTTFKSVKYSWDDRANKYQTVNIELSKVDEGTRVDSSTQAQTNKLTYRWAYLDTHVDDTDFKNGIVNKFYPEVEMYMQTHDTNLVDISNTNQISTGQGVMTIGEEKREAQNNSLYITRIYCNTANPVTGTIYSDTMSTGTQASTSTTDPVIYAGSDITLDLDTNFSMSIYGYAVDGIHKEVNTADADKKTGDIQDSVSDATMVYAFDENGNPSASVAYDDIVKSGTDIDKAWGNINNSAKLFGDYKEYVNAVLNPDNIGVDVQLTVTGDASYGTKTYNNFTCDLANILATNRINPAQKEVYPLQIKDGKVVEDSVYYKAFIKQLAKDYDCTEAEAKEIFDKSDIVKSYLDGIESSNDDFNKSQKATVYDAKTGTWGDSPNEHWYDEEVKTIVIRRYATENVKFGGAVLQDKIDYGSAPTASGNAYKTVNATWDVTLYYKNLDEMFGGASHTYNPENSNGTRQNGINSLNIIVSNLKVTGADFKIPSSSTQNMGD